MLRYTQIMNTRLTRRLASSGHGTFLASTLITGFAIGYGLDHVLGTTPVFSVVFAALGYAGGLHRIHRMLTSTIGAGGS